MNAPQPSSKRLAGLIGPILIPFAISEVMNLRIWATGLPPLTYLVGLLWSSPASRSSGGSS